MTTWVACNESLPADGELMLVAAIGKWHDLATLEQVWDKWEWYNQAGEQLTGVTHWARFDMLASPPLTSVDGEIERDEAGNIKSVTLPGTGYS